MARRVSTSESSHDMKWYFVQSHDLGGPGESLMQQGLVTPSDFCKKGEHKETQDGDLTEIRDPCKGGVGTQWLTAVWKKFLLPFPCVDTAQTVSTGVPRLPSSKPLFYR